jgi:hypothetical protein
VPGRGSAILKMNYKKPLYCSTASAGPPVYVAVEHKNKIKHRVYPSSICSIKIVDIMA